MAFVFGVVTIVYFEVAQKATMDRYITIDRVHYMPDGKMRMSDPEHRRLESENGGMRAEKMFSERIKMGERIMRKRITRIQIRVFWFEKRG